MYGRQLADVHGVCAGQLVGSFSDIFNLSLAQAVVPENLITAATVLVPEHSTAMTLN